MSIKNNYISSIANLIGGVTIPENTINTSKKCENCGSDLGVDDRFCQNCGFKVNNKIPLNYSSPIFLLSNKNSTNCLS